MRDPFRILSHINLRAICCCYIACGTLARTRSAIDLIAERGRRLGADIRDLEAERCDLCDIVGTMSSDGAGLSAHGIPACRDGKMSRHHRLLFWLAVLAGIVILTVVFGGR